MKKVLSMVLAMLLLLGMASSTVRADDFDYATDNKEATGTTTKLHKYLVVDKDTVSPAITFTYTITAGAVADAETGKLPVYAGIGTPTVANVSFDAGAATTAGGTGKPITDDTKIYAEADITINFSSIKFPKPGVYRYTLTEANSNTENVGGVKYDVDAPDGTEQTRIRTIDVYVQDTNGTLSVLGYVAYEGQVTAAPDQTYTPNGAAADGYANGDPEGSGIEDETKSNKYINQILTNTMTVQKVIAGNQGDKESKWTIRVDFTGLPANVTPKYAKVVENGQDIASPTYANYTSGTALTYGHQDKYKFIGIPEGASYTVTETNANSEGYVTTYANATYTFTSDGTIEDKDDAVVTNTRTGVIPTGVAMGIGGAVVLLGLAAVYFFTRRKASDIEE